MPAGLMLLLNGLERRFEELDEGSSAQALVRAMGLREDRVALERNGEIVPREVWGETSLRAGDRLEVVHFVGGGAGCERMTCRRSASR